MTEPELLETDERAAAELPIPAALPVLPLKETVVFPESMTPLAIGQERSVRLIDEAFAGDRRIALLTVRNNEVERA